MGVNHPVELTPGPTPAPAAATAATSPEPTGEQVRVWVKVPRSFYRKAVPKREPSQDDLRSSVERTEEIIRTAVAYVIPPSESVEVLISTIPDDIDTVHEHAIVPTTDARWHVSWWVPAGVATGVAIVLAVVLVRVLATRRPAARWSPAEAEPLRGRFKVDAASEQGPGPSERVRELIRLNPESAATVLHRWIGQGDDRE